MSENFQQTVNLKKKMKEGKRAEGIDKIYEGEEKFSNKFERPKPRSIDESSIKKWVVGIFLVIIILAAYFIFWNGKKVVEENIKNESWYAVKLTDDEIYYGKIVDTTADPVIIESVYYDYDQINNEEPSAGENKNIRLVKRGKETQGGDGSMSIVRAQVVYMEPLREDSKILQAILNYEK